MIDYDKWEEIFSSIKRHKLRTILTALSVWWGIFMLVILLGLGNGLQNSVEYNFTDDAVNSLKVYPGQTSIDHKGLPAGRKIQLNNKDYESIKNKIKEVDYLSARYYLKGKVNIKYKQKKIYYTIRSVHPDHQFLEKSKIIKGRFINDLDIKEFRKICVIGEAIANTVFNELDPIGEYLSIKNTEYKVVGVFTEEGNRGEMETIYLPISTVQKIEAVNGEVNQLLISLGDVPLNKTYEIEHAIRNELAIAHNFDINDRQAIYISNAAAEYQEYQTILIYIKGFLWFVGIGSIIAGVIGVSNIMLIVVKDRSKEIGVRKAMGATPISILRMVMQESVFLTSIAGYLGLLCGFALIYGINFIMISNNMDIEYFRNPEVDFISILLVLLLLIVAGALAGLIPALKTVKINPVIAMKN